MSERLMLRVDEAAASIGVSRSKAYELIAAGEIPNVRIGGCIRIPVAELKAWISRRATESAAGSPSAITVG